MLALMTYLMCPRVRAQAVRTGPLSHSPWPVRHHSLEPTVPRASRSQGGEPGAGITGRPSSCLHMGWVVSNGRIRVGERVQPTRDPVPRAAAPLARRACAADMGEQLPRVHRAAGTGAKSPLGDLRQQVSPADPVSLLCTGKPDVPLFLCSTRV